MRKKYILIWMAISIFIFSAGKTQAQELNIQGSEAVWEAVKGVISNPWAIFKPLEGFRPAGVDLYVWTENARNFIGEFQNALTLSPQEAVNLVLGKTSGLIWLDALVNYVKSLLVR